MKTAFVFPGGSVQQAVRCGLAAEAAGWDGFFVWDPVWGVDPWVTLAAVAVQTERIRLGTMITPLSRRRPWTLAGQTATLDQLSNGRVILAVGLGATDTGFGNFGEATDRKTRAGLLDEGLEILTGLWHGQPFSYQGKHYRVTPVDFFPPAPPVQQPRIPIWVVGAWPFPKSIARAARYDGILPSKKGTGGFRQVDPQDLIELRSAIDAQRDGAGTFDIVIEGSTAGDDPLQAAEILAPWATAGATWWIESMWDAGEDLERVMARVWQGPPRIEPA